METPYLYNFKKYISSENKYIWRDTNFKKEIFEQILYKKNKNTFIVLLKNDEKYVLYTNLFYKSGTYKIIHGNLRKYAFEEYNRFEKYLILESFYKKTVYLFSKKQHPLQKNIIHPLYSNVYSKIVYLGINYFLIYYKQLKSSKNKIKYFINNSILLSHNLFERNKDSFKVIIIQPYNNYELITEDIFHNENNFSFNINYSLNELSVNDDYETIFRKVINNFFYSILNNIPFKCNSYFLKKTESFILSNPFKVLDILMEVKDYVQESK